MPELIKHIEWKDGALTVLNQLKLPAVTEYNAKRTLEEVFYEIQNKEMSGAPLIGIAAGYGMYLGIKDAPEMPHDEFMAMMRKNGEFLGQSRPTAVNLFWGIARMIAAADELRGASVS